MSSDTQELVNLSEQLPKAERAEVAVRIHNRLVATPNLSGQLINVTKSSA